MYLAEGGEGLTCHHEVDLIFEGAPHPCYSGNYEPATLRMPASKVDMAAMLQIAYRLGMRDGKEIGCCQCHEDEHYFDGSPCRR